MSEVQDPRMEALKGRIDLLPRNSNTLPSDKSRIDSAIDRVEARRAAYARFEAFTAPPFTPLNPQQRLSRDKARYQEAIRDANHVVIPTRRGEVVIPKTASRTIINAEGKPEIHQINQLGFDVTVGDLEAQALAESERKPTFEEAHPVAQQVLDAVRENHPKVRNALFTAWGKLVHAGQWLPRLDKQGRQALAQAAVYTVGGVAGGVSTAYVIQHPEMTQWLQGVSDVFEPQTAYADALPFQSPTPGPTETPIKVENRTDSLKSPLKQLEKPNQNDLTQIAPGIYIYNKYPEGIGGDTDLDPQIGYAVDLTFFQKDYPDLYAKLVKANYQKSFPTLFGVRLDSGALSVITPYEKDLFNDEGDRLLAAVGAIQLGKVRVGAGPQDFFTLRPDQHQFLLNKIVSGEGGTQTITWNNLLYKADGSSQGIIDANGAVDANGNNKLHQTMGGLVVVTGAGGKDIQIKDLESVLNELKVPENKRAGYRIDRQLNIPDAQKTNWVRRGVNQLMPKVMWDRLVAMNDGDARAVEQNIGNPVMPFIWVITKVKGVDTLVGLQLCEYKAVTFNPLNGATTQIEFGQIQRDIALSLALPVPAQEPTQVPATSTPISQPSPTREATTTPVPPESSKYTSPIPAEIKFAADGKRLEFRVANGNDIAVNNLDRVLTKQGATGNETYILLPYRLGENPDNYTKVQARPSVNKWKRSMGYRFEEIAGITQEMRDAGASELHKGSDSSYTVMYVDKTGVLVIGWHPSGPLQNSVDQAGLLSVALASNFEIIADINDEYMKDEWALRETARQVRDNRDLTITQGDFYSTEGTHYKDPLLVFHQ